jgi:O-antigen ligase
MVKNVWGNALAIPRLRFVAPVLLGSYAAAVSLTPGVPGVVLACVPLALLLGWWAVLAPVRWLLLFFAFALLLPPLPIALGGSGPHLAVAVAALGLFAGLLRLSEWRISGDLLNGALLLYLGVLLASVTLAAVYSGPEIAAAALARVLLFGISIYVFFYARAMPSDSLRVVRFLFWTAAASAAFACLDFYFQFPAPAGFGPQFVWLPSGAYRRAQGVFYEASTLGNFCAFFLVMIAAALLRPPRESPVSRPALLAGGAVFSAALIFSYSRAALLALTAAMLALMVLHRRRLHLRRLVAIGTVCAAAGVVLAYAVLPAFVGIYWLRLRMSFEYFTSATGAVLSGRLTSWDTLVNFLFAHPWHALVGVGYKTLPYSDFIGEPVVADNMFLSMLVETGLVGLAALLLASAAILAASRRAARSANPRASFLGTWMFCFWIGQLVQMMSQDVLTYWRVLPVYFCILAMAMRELDEHPVR